MEINKILNKTYLKCSTENNTLDLDIPKSILHGKDEDPCHKKSYRPKIFRSMALS